MAALRQRSTLQDSAVEVSLAGEGLALPKAEARPSGLRAKSAHASIAALEAATARSGFAVLRRGVTFEEVLAVNTEADESGKHGKAMDYRWLRNIVGDQPFVLAKVPIAWLNDEYRVNDDDARPPQPGQETRIREYMKMQSEAPPVLVTFSGRSKATLGYVANGNHRVEAARRKSEDSVRAFVPEGDLSAWLETRVKLSQSLRGCDVPGAAIEAVVAIATASTDLRWIRSQIRERAESPSWDWDRGGCHAFAPALVKAIGGEVVGVCQKDAHWNPARDGAPGCWINMHSMARINGAIYDCRGLQSLDRAANQHKMSGSEWEEMPLTVASHKELQNRFKRDGDDYFWPNDEFLNDEDLLLLDKTMAASARLGLELHTLRTEFDALGVDSWFMHQGDRLVLSKVVAAKRGEGLGTRFMERLTALADREGRVISLTADDSYGASSVARLKRFYKRFGFEENSGRKKDYTISETMIRRPKAVEKQKGKP